MKMPKADHLHSFFAAILCGAGAFYQGGIVGCIWMAAFLMIGTFTVDLYAFRFKGHS